MSTAASNVLKVEARTRLGTRASRAMRAEGRIPATIEPDGKQPHVDIAVDEKQFLASRRHRQHLYELDLSGKLETALVRRLEWDVFGENLVHIEFRRVDKTKKTEVEVELAFIGHPKGVLNHLLTHVVVRALPTQIPDEIEVPVADLEVGASVSAGSLKMPQGVELVTSGDLLVARISELKVDLGPAPTPEAAPLEGAAAVPVAGAAPGAAPAAGAPAAGAAAKGAPEKKGEKGADKKG